MLLPSTRTCAPWIWVWIFGTAWRTNFEISLVFSSLMPVTIVTVCRAVPLAASSIGPACSALSGMFRFTARSCSTCHARLEAVFGGGVQLDRALAERDRRVGALEVEPLGELAPGLVDGVADLLQVDLAHDVEGELVFGHVAQLTLGRCGVASRFAILEGAPREDARAAKGSGL